MRKRSRFALFCCSETEIVIDSLLLTNVHLLWIVQFGTFLPIEGSTFAQFAIDQTWHVALCQFARQQIDTPLFGRIQMESTSVVIGSFESIIRFLHKRDVTNVDTFDCRFGNGRRATQTNQILSICIQ